MIPLSVILVTKNEEARIERCLASLVGRCGQVIVVDSGSRDKTCFLAERAGAEVIPFEWNGSYPKKRQWCLETIPLRYDWVFWVDADEIVSDSLLDEIEICLAQNPKESGFFITGRYKVGPKILAHGIPNRKIALFHRARMMFPVVDDLDIPGMGEIEGHYQPVCKETGGAIGTIKTPLIHEAFDDFRAWQFRHEKYARWEAGMNQKGAWPVDPVPVRERIKRFLRGTRFRPMIVFFIAYILYGGCLDGREGYALAKAKYRYYKMIRALTAGQ